MKFHDRIYRNNVGNKYDIREMMEAGEKAESEGEFEAAYAHYERAAQLGSAEAMRAIGGLYALKEFRMIETNNIMELMAQGMPAFPWNMQTQKIPNFRLALEWFIKAAEAGDAKSMCIAGTMLCEGQGCKPDVDRGLKWLARGADSGIEQAREIMALYSKPEREDIPDAEYERLLMQFESAAEAGSGERFALYERLKAGTDPQLARLGYLLVSRRNLMKEAFGMFKYCYAESGLPLIPAFTKRGAWESVIRIDLDALPSEETLIAISSDVNAFGTVKELHGLRRAGAAEYVSPSFGWLRGRKHALLLKPDRACKLGDESMKDLIARFRLTGEELAGNTALIVEIGEKEYSVEVAAITGERVDILLRYTIGGPDRIEQYAEPQLISMTMDQTE